MSDVFTHKPVTVSVRDAARIIGVGRTAIYEALGRGELDAVKDGDRTLVLMESIERRQASLPRAVIKPPKPRPSTVQRKPPAAGRRTAASNRKA